MPSPQQPIDYDTLAKQAGAISSVPASAPQPIDYDALAKQAGAISSVPPTASVSAAPKFGTLPWLKSALYSAADKYSNLLPAVGATGGGVIGGVAGAPTAVATGPIGPIASTVGGAGMGGLAGEALRRLMRQSLGFDAPQTTTENAMGIAKEGAIQGLVQAGSEALPFAAPFLKRAALGQYTRALAPTTKINKAIAQDIAPQMIQRGVHGGLESIEEQAGQQAAAIRPQLDQAYVATPPAATRGSGAQVLSALDKLKSKYIVQGKVAQPAAVDAINGVQDIIRQYGDNISPQSLRQLKQVFDDPVAHAGGYSGADLATHYSLNAQKAAANSIRSILHQASPNIAALDKEISFWLDVQKVTGASELRRTGQEGGLVKVLSPLGMGAAGTVVGISHGAVAGIETGVGSALTTAAVIAMRTPAWRTASALFKDRFADALASGSVRDVAALSARLGVATPAISQTGQSANQETPQQESPQ